MLGARPDTKPHTLSRVTRVAWQNGIFMGSARRVDIPQPGAAVAGVQAGLRQMWEAEPANGRGDFTNSCAVAHHPGIS